jgi:hypothetical protein
VILICLLGNRFYLVPTLRVGTHVSTLGVTIGDVAHDRTARPFAEKIRACSVFCWPC